jgi:hypothetical protein
MSRATVTIWGHADRARLSQLIANAPEGTRVELKKGKRSLPQNALLWQRLTDISRQVVWHGQKLTPSDWKDVFTAALRESRVVPGIDPGTFVVLGLHTSDLSKDEMAALLDLIDAFAAEHGAQLSDHREAA